jgi:hypothetical protein
MGEILGIGVTHYPPFIAPDEDRMFPLRRTLARDDRVPQEMKDPVRMRGIQQPCNTVSA